MADEVRITLRLPKEASDFLDAKAAENLTSKNAEVVRSVKERMTAERAKSETV